MNERYTGTAIALHWLIAIAIVGMLVLGFYMTDLHLSPTKIRLYNWHKWIGVSIFLLVLLRLLWRLRHPAPPLPASMSPALRLGAHLSHIGLYMLMFAMPLSGWIMSSALGFRVVWFGVLPLPNLVAKNAVWGERLEDLHTALAYCIIAIVALHALAAFKHHFYDRDDVLKRMLPGARRSFTS